ncbi:MAG: hypothetical protein JXB49_07460 [Bacteroidales bacterium]|nr:hypothetical protein [Bacteroidales bacterium]
MRNTFFDESVKIADDFIRTICFVDDEVIFQNESTSDHLIDGNLITKAFAERGKACCFFNFQSIDEQKSIIRLIQNSDVCVLDWKLTLPNPDINQIPAEIREEDVEDNSDRGRHAKEIINEIFQSPNNSPKLIIIYTGETESQPIYDSIKNLFNEIETNENFEELWFQNSKLRISIYFKPGKTYSHLEEVARKVAEYSDLPTIISMEFASLTNGIISNVVLTSITSLRDNTNKLLQIYKKELDPAYLAHRGMLVNPEDAEILLKNSILNSIDSILTVNNVSRISSISEISKWIDSIDQFQNDTLSLGDVSLSIEKETLIKWMEKGFISTIKELWESTQKQQISEKKIINLERDLHKLAIEYFCPRSLPNSNLNEDFAILTHHNSNLINPSFVPYLTLGVVIERNDRYLLCIQQRCDSVRLSKSSARTFLFIPLEESDKSFSIIFKNTDNKYIKLKVNNRNSYNLITLSFYETKNGTVFAIKEWSYYKFCDTFQRRYKWILTLNDSHAQKLANEFAANLSRIGLDESEWLRRNGNA